jgi:hypothetical protein
MQFSARLSITLRLIRFSLFPAVTPDRPPDIPVLPVPCHSLSPEELCACLVNPGQHADTTQFCFFVTGAFPLAAPFVLFRLKRWGFSGCRVLVDQEGLCIKARR